MRPITPPFPITFTFIFLADAFLLKRFARGCLRCIGANSGVFVCRLTMQWSAGVHTSVSVIKHMPCEHMCSLSLILWSVSVCECACVWSPCASVPEITRQCVQPSVHLQVYVCVCVLRRAREEADSWESVSVSMKIVLMCTVCIRLLFWHPVCVRTGQMWCESMCV